MGQRGGGHEAAQCGLKILVVIDFMYGDRKNFVAFE